MKRTNRIAYLLLLCSIQLLASAGCSTVSSSYEPKRIKPGEVTWAYDDELYAVRDGERHELTDLSDLLGCVPEAEEHASSASLEHGAAIGFMGTGLATVLGGGALSIGGAVDDVNTEMLVAGLGTMVGGALLTLVGRAFSNDVTPTAVDAVNIYNDRYESTPGCQEQRLAGSPPRFGGHSP